MSLPPGFLDELRTRVSLSSVVGRKVTWDVRKSNQGKGDMWAPCPFHQEKSASFHVDDRKGYYYCFGCHAKGDALTFVKETENLSFIEAVELLAREAGMVMPARDPQDVQRTDTRNQLTDVMEEAVKWFRLQLKTSAAAEARAALTDAGLRGCERTPVRRLSQGQRRRCGLARLLLSRSTPLWVLDEPFNALDADACRWLAERLGEHLQRGGLLVLTSHQSVPLPPPTRELQL